MNHKSSATVWWTQSRPLKAHLQQQLDQASIQSYHQPFIQLRSLTNEEVKPLPKALEEPYYLLIISQMAADSLAQRLEANDWSLDNASLIVMGKATSNYCQERYDWPVAYTSDNLTAEELFQSEAFWTSLGQANSQQLVVPLGNRSLGKYSQLGQAYLPNWQVFEWLVYTNVATTAQLETINQTIRQMSNGDYLVIASSSAWDNLMLATKNCPDQQQKIKQLSIIALGPLVQAAIQKDHYQVFHVMSEFSLEAVVHYLLKEL